MISAAAALTLLAGAKKVFYIPCHVERARCQRTCSSFTWALPSTHLINKGRELILQALQGSAFASDSVSSPVHRAYKAILEWDDTHAPELLRQVPSLSLLRPPMSIMV